MTISCWPRSWKSRDYYREVNAFWVPERGRWEGLRAHAKQADIGKRIDDALTLIEQENPHLKGILDKRYARAQLPDGQARRAGGSGFQDWLWQ